MTLPQNEQAEVQRLGKEALLLSVRLRRPLTRDDLFLTLHVPWNLQDTVMRAINQVSPLPLDRLTSEEWERLETASTGIIARALQSDGKRIEKKGLSLADVAANAPRDWTLDQVKQLFGYVAAVLQLQTLPQRESWPIEVQGLARRARAVPMAERTVLGLVAALGIGVYKARLVMAALG